MNNILWIKEQLSKICNKNDIWVDMTAGNGYDTLTLCQLVKQVYSIDIQMIAINNSKILCQNHKNIEYIIDDHQFIDKYIKTPINGAIYNLGYLPKSDHTIKTNSLTTVNSLVKIHQLLVNSGYIVISCYVGHEGGKEEYENVTNWFSQHNYKLINKLEYDNPIAPKMFVYQKIKE